MDRLGRLIYHIYDTRPYTLFPFDIPLRSQFLITEQSVCCVPWDDAGAFCAFRDVPGANGSAIGLARCVAAMRQSILDCPAGGLAGHAHGCRRSTTGFAVGPSSAAAKRCRCRRLSWGLVVAENIAAEVDSPPYDKAMMDGYAFRHSDLPDGKATLTVVEEITDGRSPTRKLQAGEAARIMTGAPLLEGADAVMMIERTHILEGSASLSTISRRSRNRISCGAAGRCDGVKLSCRQAAKCGRSKSGFWRWGRPRGEFQCQFKTGYSAFALPFFSLLARYLQITQDLVWCDEAIAVEVVEAKLIPFFAAFEPLL